MAKILIVDDEMPIRRTLREILEFEQYDVDEATDGLECLAKVQKEKYDVIIMDIKMPKMDGIEALERLQILSPETPVVMVSGHGNIETAVDAVKKGAFDYISKPPDLNRMLITIRNAMEKADLVNTTRVLQKQVKSAQKGVVMIGESAPILEIKRLLDRVAPTDSRVLITGPNGTGKELVARWIHQKSNRADGPIIEVNCAAIPAELIESELFGHKKGSFTGAVADRPGKFEQANGGTLFMDEIGDMSLDAQAKVLRALQESKITRVGDSKEIKVDVRVLAATNKDLKQEIEDGRFREDLYHRLAVIVVQVPSLNDRRDDIPLLLEHFNRRIADDYGHAPKVFTPEAIEALKDHNWTGNIRELANVVERLFILCDHVVSAEEVQRYV
ncbi:MAG: sigma-54-dependent transcriptional regulator [Saprospiraceae bacterium]